VAGGLTLMHMVEDFLKRCITSLQQRARLCCWFTGSNDISRIQRGPGTDLTWDELEVLVKGITGESFIHESLIIPQGNSALCDDPGLRTAILAMLPTLDESGVAVRQTGGRDPHRGIQISDASAGGPQSVGMAPSAPARASRASAVAPAPWTRAKELQAAPPPQAAPGCRRKRGDTGCTMPTDRLFWTPSPPLGPRRSAPRSVRGLLVGSRRSGSRPRARRGTSVLRHHNHHHRRVRRHHHHSGAVGSAATTTTTTVGFATTTTTWGRSPPGAPAAEGPRLAGEGPRLQGGNV
jgi:hypothetical protein